ncbi:melatonin receptor type 1B-B-like [Glandiceps talaboti]
MANLSEYNTTFIDKGGVPFHKLVREEPFIGFYMAVTIMLCIMGTCGNIMVIATVLMYSKLRTVSNIFIVNLALADLGVTGLVDVFTLVGIATTHRFLPPKTSLCIFVGSFCLICCICSLWNIMMVSINRYIYICKSDHYRKIYTVPNALAMAIGVWVICFLIDFPNFVGWGDHGYDGKTMVCSYSRTASFSWIMFFIFSAVGLPLCVILGCYLRVYLFVRRHATKIAGGFKTKNWKIRRKDIQLMKTLFAIFIVFSLCWIPYALVVAIDYNDTFPQTVHMVFWIMAHGNSAMDSVLYGIMNKQFRHGYFIIISKMLCCCNLTKNSVRSNRVAALTSTVMNDKHSTERHDIADTQTQNSHM